MTTSSPVCRTCLGIISEGKTGYNIDDENGIIKNVRNIREMMLFCVPEMDVYISVGPSICDTCLVTLVSVYNFKIRCMRVENAIRSYIVANNVMEGSCVDLSNVVRQQIIEALKQKNWPPSVIRDYISKVDKCLQKSKNNSKMPIPLEVFNTMRQNFNVPNSLSNIPASSSRNVEIPSPNTNMWPNTLIECNPALNRLLESSAAVSTPLSPPPSYEQALRHDSVEKGPPSTYLSVSKNLMPEEPVNPFMVINPLHSRPVNPVRMTPNLTLRGPPKLPEVPPLPTLENVQNVFLSSLNLINTNRGDREEAVMITQDDHLTVASGSQRARNRKNTKSAGSGATCAIPASSSNNDNVDLCPKTGVLQKASKKSAVGNLRAVRKSPGPKSKRKVKNAEQDTIIVLNDDDPPATKKDDGEVLIMNFDVDENLAQPNVDQPSVLKDALTSPDPPSRNTNAPVLLKETMKRKLSPEDAINEILSKQRRLIVKLNSNLPYLHKNKKLIVKLPNHKFNRCRFCSVATLNVKDLNNHYKEHHKMCKLCDFMCFTKPQLDLHIDIHHQQHLKEVMEQYENYCKIRRCVLCQYVGVSDFDLRDHRIRIHIKPEMNGVYKCPFQCGLESTIPYAIAKHCEVKHDNAMGKECPMCNHTSETRYRLKDHIRTHSVQKKIICPECGVSFRSPSILGNHIKKKHKDVLSDEEEVLVYASTPGRLGTLRTDADGKITLNFPAPGIQPSNPAPPENIEGLNMFSLHGLAEMLYSQTLEEIPEQENDCIILDDVSQEKSPSGTEKKKRKTPSKKTVVSDDSDDCMIVDEEQEVLTISDEETTPENCNKKRKTNDSNSDKTSDVIVIGKDSIAQHDEPSKNKELPDDSDTVTSSEVSSAQTISSQSVERSTSDILTKSVCQDIGSENPISDGSVSQTGAKESEDSKEEGTSRKDNNLDLEGVENTFNTEESTSTPLGPKAVKEVRISEDIRENRSNASASEKPVSDGNVSQSEHEDGKSGSNENAQKGSNTKELEASKDQEESPVTEENSTSVASNKIASDQITVEKESSSQLTNDPDQATSKSSEISTELNEYSLEKQDNAEANPVICSDSVLIESSDEDSNDCTIITKETLENLDDPSKATNKNIETDKADNSKAVHTGTQKQSNPTDKLSETYLKAKSAENTEPLQSVPDTVQDSDDNIIISDSVSANPEVIQKILDVELTKEAVDKDDGQMLIKDVKIAEDAEEKENSQTDVKSVASENDSESVKSKQTIPVENNDSNETTNKKANDVELSIEKNTECRETKDSDVKTKENLSELDLEPENSEVIPKILDVKPTEKAQEELTEKVSDISKAESEMESENTESTLVLDKDDSQVSIKNLKVVENEKEKENSQIDIYIASENNSKSVKDKQIVSAENSETSNKKAHEGGLPKVESTECRKAKDSDGKSNENLSEKEISQTDVKSVDSENNSKSVKSKQIIPSENSDSNETINKKANVVELSKEKPLECRETKESDGKTKENLSELNLEPENPEVILEVELTKKLQEELAENVPKILKSDSEIESENIQSTSAVVKDDCHESIKSVQIADNGFKENTEIGVKSVESENNSGIVKDKEIILAKSSDCNETSNKKADECGFSKEEGMECRKAKDSDGKSEENLSELNNESSSNTVTENNYSKPYNEVTESDKLSKELVPESTIENVTHKQVISVENSECNKKDVGESSKDEMTQCKETENNDGESEDNLSEWKIESEISDKSDNNVAKADQIFENLVTESDIVLEGNITDKKSDDDTVHLKVIMADSIEAENSDSEKTKSMKEVSTLEDRTDTDDTDILLKEKGVSNETHCVRNETPETSDLINKSEIVDT